jgi:cellulose synthase/poly-beta-1,6-N-acetylglucosamine synthase-like glycosyltransferase
MMNDVSVDIIIAAKNEGRFIGSCLNAIKEQAYPPTLLEVHVVDNCSADDTAQIAQQHGAHVWRQPRGGAGAARNLGIARSSGEFVAFLDAHCIPERQWVRSMVRHCRIDGVGGCQGSIENRSVNPRVQKYLEESGALSNERVLADTISGKRNLYPWILSGNSMYRRDALIEAGLFTEGLQACEDVDLAWRVVLLGYQLGYNPAAKVVHYDCRSWHAFLKKGFHYGRSAALLTEIYKSHGASNKFTPGQIWSAKPERLLSGLYYWSGFKTMEYELKLKLNKPPIVRFPSAVLGRFRPDFKWTSSISLSISDQAVFWFREDENTSVIVHLPTRQRVVLESVGDFIWRHLVEGVRREKLIHKLVAHYGVAYVTAGADLDDFVDELVDAGILRNGCEVLPVQPDSSSLGP